FTALRSWYLTTQEVPAMNAFFEHHQDNIRFGYRCFDRILLNGLIQPFQQPERVIGFFPPWATCSPSSTVLPVMFAVKTWPSARKPIASRQPAAPVSARSMT